MSLEAVLDGLRQIVADKEREADLARLEFQRVRLLAEEGAVPVADVGPAERAWLDARDEMIKARQQLQEALPHFDGGFGP